MNISDEELVEQAVMNANMRFENRKQLKCCVSLIFAIPNDVAEQLCLRFRYRPDQMVNRENHPKKFPLDRSMELLNRRAFLLFVAYADKIQTLEEATDYWKNELSPYDRAEWVRRAAEYHKLLDQNGAQS